MKLLVHRLNAMHRPAVRALRLCLGLVLLAVLGLLFCAMFAEGVERDALRLSLPEAGEYIAASVTLTFGGGFLFDYLCADQTGR